MHFGLGSEKKTYETHLGKLNLYSLENELQEGNLIIIYKYHKGNAISN